MNMQQKRVIGLGSVVVLAVAAWVGIRLLPDTETIVEELPPSLSNITAKYVTSSKEVVIGWQVENVEISESNTGVRYDYVSHNTTTVTSESYPLVGFPKKHDERFEARIPVTNEEELFYRIQLSHNNEFLWSDEGIILILE